MKVYISGPITGTDDYMSRFMTAQIFLEMQGYDVVNPASANSALPKDTTWEKYMGESLKLLCECDAIFLLRNWTKSRGAKVENLVAVAMGKEFMYEENYAE